MSGFSKPAIKMKGCTMKRNTGNFLIDILTFLVFFAKVWTGLLIHYVLPPGGGRGHALTLWGMNRHDYGKIHFYLALAMVALIIVHLWLHWSWICSVLSNLLGAPQPKRIRRFLYGMVLLLVICIVTAGSLLLVETQVKYTYGEDPGRYGYEDFETHELPYITGRTTLSQAAEMAGISVEQLISELKLPSNVSPSERLGRLKRQYGFEIEDVRRIASRKTNRAR
jgi:hypothetical protein